VRYLLLGDSQAEGAPGRALEAALRAQGHEVVRVAASGQGAISWATRRRDEVTELVARVRPDRIVLLFGSNDSPTHPLFDEALTWFARAGVFYSGPPGYLDDERRPVGAAIRERAKAIFGRRYLDVWPATLRVPSYYGGDGVHMTAAGGEAWARAVLKQLPSFPWLRLGAVGALAVGAYAIVRRWT
jgi:lysophospholipase L1-like esterase